MRIPILALALLAAGCAEPAVAPLPADGPIGDLTPVPDVTPVGDEDDGVAAAPRPETMDMTLMVEGEPEVRPMRLLDLPSFPVPFSSYVPEDASVEQPGSGDAVSIEWGDYSRITVNVPVFDSRDALLARLISGVPEDSETVPVEVGWASDGYRYIRESGGQSTVETIHIAEHDGSTFLVQTTVSLEMGDGFAPVFEALLDQWRWADGTPLR